MGIITKDRALPLIIIAFLGTFSFFVLMIILSMLGLYDPNAITQDGTTLSRKDERTIRMSWGMESGVSLSPWSSLRGFAMRWDLMFPTEDAEAFFVKLTSVSESWTMDVEDYGGMPATFTGFVNPRLKNARERMFQIIELSRSEPVPIQSLTRLAAQDYIYLGYVVRDQQEAAALAEALIDRSGTDLSADIDSPAHTFYRLAKDVELRLLEGPKDDAAAERLRATLPVMVERVDTTRGHPGDTCHVAFLDGHIEELSFGSQWPATQAFMDTFPAPTK